MIKEPFQTNLSDVLIWQYNEATKLQELVKSEQSIMIILVVDIFLNGLIMSIISTQQ